MDQSASSSTPTVQEHPMGIDRRSFHRIAGAALVAAFGAGHAVAASQGRTEAEGGLRSGKIFTSTNDAAGNELLAFGSDGSGGLVQVATYATQGLGAGTGLGSQGAVTLSGDGRWLFVVNAGSNTVSTFAVRASGLTLASVQDSGGLRPISVAERDGLVYVLNADGAGNVAGFRNQGGTLVPVAGSVQPLSAAGGTGPAQVAIGPDSDVLVVTEKATNRVLTYALAADGSAGAPQITASAGVTPFGFAIDRRGRLLVSEAGASSLSSYRLDGTTPVVVSAAVVNGQAAACWAAVTPNGRYAYTGNAGTGTVSLYAINGQGAATLVAGAAGSTANGGAGDLAIAGHGRTLGILAPRTPAIFRFDVATDGTLTPAGSVSGLPAGVVGLAAN
jgi:6-phosphogluconolactonase (cycloisomerase 2 family)